MKILHNPTPTYPCGWKLHKRGTLLLICIYLAPSWVYTIEMVLKNVGVSPLDLLQEAWGSQPLPNGPWAATLLLQTEVLTAPMVGGRPCFAHALLPAGWWGWWGCHSSVNRALALRAPTLPSVPPMPVPSGLRLSIQETHLVCWGQKPGLSIFLFFFF